MEAEKEKLDRVRQAFETQWKACELVLGAARDGYTDSERAASRNLLFILRRMHEISEDPDPKRRLREIDDFDSLYNGPPITGTDRRKSVRAVRATIAAHPTLAEIIAKVDEALRAAKAKAILEQKLQTSSPAAVFTIRSNGEDRVVSRKELAAFVKRCEKKYNASFNQALKLSSEVKLVLPSSEPVEMPAVYSIDEPEEELFLSKTARDLGPTL